MSADLPIACSLSATELPVRLAEMADLGRAALLDARVDGGRAELRFASGACVRERVDAIVVAESRCCEFLTMSVAAERDTVLLIIDAPGGAEDVLPQFVEAFSRPDAGRLTSASTSTSCPSRSA